MPEILPIVELDFGKWDESRPKVSDREVRFGPETDGSPRLVMARDASVVYDCQVIWSKKTRIGVRFVTPA